MGLRRRGRTVEKNDANAKQRHRDVKPVAPLQPEPPPALCERGDCYVKDDECRHEEVCAQEEPARSVPQWVVGLDHDPQKEHDVYRDGEPIPVSVLPGVLYAVGIDTKSLAATWDVVRQHDSIHIRVCVRPTRETTVRSRCPWCPWRRAHLRHGLPQP